MLLVPILYLWLLVLERNNINELSVNLKLRTAQTKQFLVYIFAAVTATCLFLNENSKRTLIREHGKILKYTELKWSQDVQVQSVFCLLVRLVCSFVCLFVMFPQIRPKSIKNFISVSKLLAHHKWFTNRGLKDPSVIKFLSLSKENRSVSPGSPT